MHSVDTMGLTVEFDGKKNVVLADGKVTEYPIGGMACEYARLHPTDIKQFILDMPLYEAPFSCENLANALMQMYEAMVPELGQVTAIMVTTDFSNLLTDYTQSTDSERSKLLAQVNENNEGDAVKDFILKDTGFEEFGIATVGQTFLSVYSTYAYSYVGFKSTFNTLMSDDDLNEENLQGFFALFDVKDNFQHFDFNIYAYGGGFHSVYTIKSSVSLIVFEAAHMVDANVKAVKCKNCGNYFIPIGRADRVYCSYPSPQDKSKACRDIGAQNTLVRKRKNDAASSEYRRLYMRLTMQQKRHPQDEQVKKWLEELTTTMQDLRKQRDDGEISSDKILEWLELFSAHLEK